jgi:hypothetical protein
VAARLSRAAWPALVVLSASLVASGCASTDRPAVQPDQVPRPTPLRSWDPSIDSVVSQLRTALSAIGLRLDPPPAAYVPSEPPSLLQAPRVVLRADLADPEDGFVVVYDAADAAQARGWGDDLAAYLGSGFGQSNFTPDTQFSVAVLDDAVIFTSWSPGRSSDAAQAQAVFEALAGVGEPVEIVR